MLTLSYSKGDYHGSGYFNQVSPLEKNPDLTREETKQQVTLLERSKQLYELPMEKATWESTVDTL